MKTKGIIGLGEPEPFGKQSLFQPPEKYAAQSPIVTENAEKPLRKAISTPKTKTITLPEERIRMALDVTRQSLSIMQELQGQYRLATGHMLPKWKIISEALELYKQAKVGEGNEHTK